MAAIQRVRRLPVHDEKLTLTNDVATSPGRQRSVASIARASLPHRNAIDRDDKRLPAGSLASQGKHALKPGDPDRQIAVLIKERGERLGG